MIYWHVIFKEQVKFLENNEQIIMTYGNTIIGRKEDEMTILGKTDKENKKVERGVSFIEPQLLSVKRISSAVKIFASPECNPHCEYNCGQPNGCGGICGIEDMNKFGLCGNPMEFKEAEDVTQAYEMATIGISNTFQVFLNFILVD